VLDALFLNVIEPTTTKNKYMCDLKFKKMKRSCNV